MAQYGNPYYVAPIDPSAAMLEGMEMRDLREQYGARKKLQGVMRGVDINNPQSLNEAAGKAFQINPQAAQPYIQMLDRMDERQRAQAQQLREATGRIALQIKSAPPEQKAALWQQAAGMYPDAFGAQYQPGAEDMILAEAQSFDQMMERYQKQQEAAAKAREPVKMNEGDVLFDPTTGKRIFSVPKTYAPQAPSDFDRMLAAAGIKPGSLEAQEYAKRKLAGSGGIVVGQDENGNPVVSIGGNGAPALKEYQSKDTNFLIRGQAAQQALGQMQDSLLDLGQQGMNQIPVIGNYLVDSKFRRAKQAGAEFLAIVLRKDTGAAVTPQEFDFYGPIYLPWPGDDAATLEQKAASRENVLAGLRAGAGPGNAFAPNPNVDKDSATPAPKTQQDYDALAPGTQYQHPDDPPGTLRTKS